MLLVEIDRPDRLVKITYAGHVGPEDARDCLERLRFLLADVQPGFRLLADLSGVTSMPTITAPYIGQIMDTCAGKGIELVVRVPPSEPRNDIGLAILSRFHYGPEVRIVNCQSLEEAASHLAQ